MPWKVRTDRGECQTVGRAETGGLLLGEGETPRRKKSRTPQARRKTESRSMPIQGSTRL